MGSRAPRGGEAAAGLLTVELRAGEITLRTARGEARERVLDRATRRLPDLLLALAVSSAGRHLRGTLGSELVVHGHEPALPEGRVGLFLEGCGPAPAPVRIAAGSVHPSHHQ